LSAAGDLDIVLRDVITSMNKIIVYFLGKKRSKTRIMLQINCDA
jgi:hypothetical protein